MKLLHILKSEPDDKTKTLIEIISTGEETTVFNLYNNHPDYGKLIDLIFEHDKILSWW